MYVLVVQSDRPTGVVAVMGAVLVESVNELVLTADDDSVIICLKDMRIIEIHGDGLIQYRDAESGAIVDTYV